MINFRFHIVSITAVFLALAIGIVMGVSVIDQATVSQLERGLKTAERRAAEVGDQNDALRAELDRWAAFSEQAGDALVEGRLADVPVVIVSVAGVSDDVLSALRAAVSAAGATVGGVMRFVPAFALDEPADVRRLAEVTGVTESRAEDVRTAAVNRLAREMADGAAPFIAALQGARFVDLDGPVDPSAVVVPGTRFLVVSSRDASVANAELAVPFVAALGAQADGRLVVAEPAVIAPEDGDDEKAGPFILAVRDQGSRRLSTVDNVADFRGRVAAVLALAALGSGRMGDYGVAAGADRLLPELAS